jgi:hypothetical protein
MLLATAPDTLLGIRADESGQAYVEAMRSFHANPSDENWENYKFAIDIYSGKISAAVAASVESGRKVRYDKLDAGVAAGGATAAGLVDAAFAIAGMPPPFTTVGLISGALVATAVYTRKLVTGKAGRGTESLPIEGRTTGDIRIDLPG